MIAEVIPEKRTGPDKDTFSYLVPEKLQSQIQVGSIVDIPFSKKDIRGAVFALNSVIARSKATKQSEERLPQLINRLRNDAPKFELKEIKSISSDFTIPEQYLKIAKWISDYYLCSLGEAISLFLPPRISRPRLEKHSPLQTPHSKLIKLTSEQEEIFQKLKNKLQYCSSLSRTKNDNSSQSPSALSNNKALIHGVTGSGKTEVYLKLASETLKLGKQVVVLVPEIMLTPQTIDRFEQIFPDQVCIMHSGLSKSERYLNYKQFSIGEKKIIIGPRSALLVPNINIGLIIIDEEQEDAYKQEKDPRYHAVDLAEKIAEKTGALLVLGTATPRVETYYKAVACHSREGGNPETKRTVLDPRVKPEDDNIKDCHGFQPRNDTAYDLFELKSRYQKLILPTAQVIDLKNEIKYDNFSPISLLLQKNIKDVLVKKRHAILFLNRRGTATFVSCRECGEVINCPRCNIPMVYHINYDNHVLNCHHCDYKAQVPAVCPACKSPKIKFFGAGVDKIESEVKKQFPKARIRKIDSKSLQNKGEYMKLYEDLQNGKIDILIGTQILAKGLDIGTVDLVGVISADVGLHLPHFRATEKTFSLITQVSGRSGRKSNVGRTIIQTYWPESSSIKFAADHDYAGFYRQEIKERKKFNYPPFCHLVRVVSEDRNKQKARDNIFAIAQKLSQKKIGYIGPGPCFLSKINNKFRYHLIIKTNILPDPKITEIFKTNPYLIWDADPLDLL